MDISNVCRTCLRVPKTSKNLFESENGLLAKIKTIASVVIDDNQELPHQICEECFTNINTFYNFRKVIITTDHDLKARLKTLKRINYSHKARSKMKSSGIQPDSGFDNMLVLDSIKSENSSQDMLEDNLSTIKALSTSKLFKCNQCKELFDTKLKLNSHRRSKHTQTGICNVCGAVVRGDNLSKHIKLHSDTPAKCQECGRMFKNSESLRSHKFLHVDNCYTCHICGRVFRMKGEHTRHLKVHADPDYRKSTCPLCGKKVHEMKKHMQTHTGQKPHFCSHCNKGFSSPYALKVHGRQHTNERPYVCDHCGFAFLQRVSLKTHLLSKHGIISDNCCST